MWLKTRNVPLSKISDSIYHFDSIFLAFLLLFIEVLLIWIKTKTLDLFNILKSFIIYSTIDAFAYRNMIWHYNNGAKTNTKLRRLPFDWFKLTCGCHLMTSQVNPGADTCQSFFRLLQNFDCLFIYKSLKSHRHGFCFKKSFFNDNFAIPSFAKKT